MNNIEQNSLRIAELLGYKKLNNGYYYNPDRHIHHRSVQEVIDLFVSYTEIMPLVFECNYEQDDLDIEIMIYGSGLDVHLNDEDILITTFDTKEGFIQAIQLAVIKYLELKNG